MRRYYIELAAALRDARPNPTQGDRRHDEHQGWQAAVDAVCDTLTKLNRAFDHRKFMRDCGYDQ